MPYVYVGLPSPYAGKPLFNILNNLKNFGVGRIVYKTTDYKKCDKPSFFRILFAQPEMDDKNLKGRVVAERVYKGIRDPKPVNISDEVEIEDYRLVPIHEESKFCRWESIRDYDMELDAIPKPKFMEMPPLLKRMMKESKLKKGESVKDEDLLLPAHKIYEGNVKLLDQVETNKLSAFITGEFADFKDFNIDSIPFEEWNLMRFIHPVGTRIYLSDVEGKGWEKQQERLQELEELEKKVKEL